MDIQSIPNHKNFRVQKLEQVTISEAELAQKFGKSSRPTFTFFMNVTIPGSAVYVCGDTRSWGNGSYSISLW